MRKILTMGSSQKSSYFLLFSLIFKKIQIFYFYYMGGVD
jgi:hypothetical protein